MRAWNFNDDNISQRVASGEPATTCCGPWCVEMQATGKMQFSKHSGSKFMGVAANQAPTTCKGEGRESSPERERERER